MKDSSIANNGSKVNIIIHLCLPNSYKQQRRQTKEPDPVTKCSEECDGSLKLQHLTDTRSTQVFPYDLDPGNFSHPKNQSTQTEQLHRHNKCNQTVSCSQSSNASQTVYSYYDKPGLGPFSDETTTGISNNSSSTSSSYNRNSSSSISIRKAYLNRLMKIKPDEPDIHGPFFCDCPGGLDFCKQYQVSSDDKEISE